MVIRVQWRGVKVSHMLDTSKRSTLISAVLHCGVIALALLIGRITPVAPAPVARVTPLVAPNLTRYIPRLSHRGGGGGGASDLTPASKGPLPRIALRQFTPPAAVLRNYNPALAVEPTLVGTPQIMASMPNISYGDPNGVAGPPSGGRGTRGGIGDGGEGGVGNRRGPGAGDDDGTGVYGQPGPVGKVVEPVLLTKVDPEYSDEARRAKLQGIVTIKIDVDKNGHPANILVVRGLGLGLDEKAVESVMKWRFKPGAINGKPAVTSAVIEVTFRLL